MALDMSWCHAILLHSWPGIKNTGILALPTFLALLACHGHILKPQGGVRREYR